MDGGGFGGQSDYQPPREVTKLLGISYSTLRRWTKSNRIEYITLPSGNRLYDVSPFRHQTKALSDQKVCYCRVSTQKQAPYLNNQVEFCKQQFPNHRVITDIGSL